MGDQGEKRRIGGARQQEEQSRGEDQDPRRDADRQQRQPRMETPQPRARGGRSLGHRPPDLSAGERRNAENQVKRQEQEEVEVVRQYRSGNQLQKRDHGRIKVIPAGLRREDLDHREEEHQVYARPEKRQRKEKVVEYEEARVCDRRQRGRALRDLEAERSVDHQGAHHQPRGREGHRGDVEITGPSHRQVAARHQPQQRELEETLYGNSGARVATRHVLILTNPTQVNAWSRIARPLTAIISARRCDR